MFDAVIIGAGIGGLVCGCNLARNGKKVAIFEQHSLVGGCCTSFKRKEFQFDAGAHLFCECSDVGSLNVILKKLDIKYEFIQYTANDIIYIGNKKYNCPHKIKEFLKFLENNFRDEKDNIRRFFLDIKKRENINKFENIAYEELLKEYFKNQDLKKILSAMWLFAGSVPNELCASDGISIFQSYWKEGAFYPKGGAQKFSDTFADKFNEYGGKLFLSSKVVKISKVGRVYRVKLENGSEYSARVIVNNGDFKALKNICNNSVTFSEDARKYMNLGEESSSIFSTYWALKCDDERELNISGWYLSEADLNSKSAILLTVPSLYDKTLCADGYHILQTFSMDNYESKENQLDVVREKIQGLILDFNKKVISLETANWKTIQRYTVNYNGSPYGWKHSINQGGRKRMNSLIGDNIHQVGHWTQLGSGIKSVVISGILVSRSILGKEGLY